MNERKKEEGTSSEIAEFYKGRSVFITGATGFLGKVIVEKLLRDCPGVEKIYIFARPSKSTPATERVKEILSGELFDGLRKTQEGFESKVIAVEGDLVLEGLGISNLQAEEVRQNVSIIMHCAATVNFNEKLSNSLQINVVSTDRLLSFAKTMPNISAFVHVSTAYAHCDRTHIEEKLYPPLINPQSLIEMVNSISDETVISNLTEPLLGKRPNTYTFTKSIAEEVVRANHEHVPAAIVRPSIICGAHDGPIPGWVDNLNGPGGLYLAVGHNLIVAMPGNPEAVCDLIPVDFCSNMIIAAAWRLSEQKTRDDITVYNCTSGGKNPLKWGDHGVLAVENITARPPTKPSIVRKPSFSMYKKNTFDYLIEPLMHLLPIHVMDFILFLTGKNPSMRRLYRKVKSSISAYSFFTSHHWTWDDENVSILLNSMNHLDRKVFNCDPKTINWNQYISDYYDGCRKIAKRSQASSAKFVGGGDTNKKELSKTSSQSSTSFIIIFSIFLLILSFLSMSYFNGSFPQSLFQNITQSQEENTCSNQKLGDAEC